MGRRRRTGRDVHGIVLLDKPIGRSSNHVLQQVRRLFQANKAGHTGSLDPLATGVLPICLGHATKVSSLLLDSDKAYQFEMLLGVTTTTGDSEGEVLTQSDVPDVSVADVDRLLNRFTGSIAQIPPMYSALKHQGQPLYKLARAGKEVERAPRQVTIHRLELLKQCADRWLLEVECSKGTYVRTLAQDLGAALGCGAHVSLLRRTQAGPFSLKNAVTLETLESLALESLGQYLLSVDAALPEVPEIWLDADQAEKFQHGQSIQMSSVPEEALIRIYAEERGLIGLGKCLEDGRLAPRRVF